MGGSRGSTVVSQPLTRQQYDPTGYKYREMLFPRLYQKYDTGLTPEEMGYYKGHGLTELMAGLASQRRQLGEQAARAGISGGPLLEAYSDLARMGIMGRAQLASDLIAKDIEAKQKNLANLMALISETGPVGTASQTTYPPRNPLQSGITGGFGGGLAGYAIGGPWGAGIGSILGLLGGIL